MPVVDLDDADLLAKLRAGDEDAFRQLVSRYHRSMVRVAASYVGGSEAVAEEVVQETWLGVLRGLARFEGRSSLKTWIFSILLNQARSRGQKEHRSVPMDFGAREVGDLGPSVDPGRFCGPGDPFDGYWLTAPERFSSVPEEHLTSAETLALIDETIRSMPDHQGQVVTLRDVDGWSAEEVCACLGLSEGNQRVLLCRARGRLRAVLETHFSLLEAV